MLANPYRQRSIEDAFMEAASADPEVARRFARLNTLPKGTNWGVAIEGPRDHDIHQRIASLGHTAVDPDSSPFIKKGGETPQPPQHSVN